ncbi:MAG: lipopolysaccharide assembly protein LapA domain-containing protein [Pseudomonadota bacterium]
MRKFLTIAVLVPLAIVIVMFAVANRELITVSFDPFDTVHPALAMRLPLFVLIFILVGLGVFIGGVAAWLRQSKWRARARRAEAEARRLREQIDAQRARPALPAAAEPSTFAIPPAA